jgi:hypothetical protein
VRLAQPASQTPLLKRGNFDRSPVFAPNHILLGARLSISKPRGTRSWPPLLRRFLEMPFLLRLKICEVLRFERDDRNLKLVNVAISRRRDNPGFGGRGLFFAFGRLRVKS